ncbi:MAG: hypothetical protein QOF09_5021 [Alphaproteobacteria bacterium]|nr:hypothetical protein [Alphaproteobacteria bacterium]
MFGTPPNAARWPARHSLPSASNSNKWPEPGTNSPRRADSKCGSRAEPLNRTTQRRPSKPASVGGLVLPSRGDSTFARRKEFKLRAARPPAARLGTTALQRPQPPATFRARGQLLPCWPRFLPWTTPAPRAGVVFIVSTRHGRPPGDSRAKAQTAVRCWTGQGFVPQGPGASLPIYCVTAAPIR